MKHKNQQKYQHALVKQISTWLGHLEIKKCTFSLKLQNLEVTHGIHLLMVNIYMAVSTEHSD